MTGPAMSGPAMSGPAMSGPATGVPGTGGSPGQVPLEHRVLVLWRIRAAVGVSAVSLIACVIAALTAPAPAAIAVVAIVVLLAGGFAWWWTGLVWRSWRFEVGTASLHLRHGVFTRRASTIPFHRVQHIDLEAGPLERRLRLTTLVLRTASASTDSTVPGIDSTDAEAVRDRILALVGTGDAT